MRKLAVFIILSMTSAIVFAQDMAKFRLYTPGENANKKLPRQLREQRKKESMSSSRSVGTGVTGVHGSI